MSEEEAIKKCKQIIQDNNEIIKEARKNNDTNTIQLTASLDNESIAIETVLNMLEEKDKIIDLMARAIDSLDSQLVICKYKDKEDVKKKFLEYYKENCND